MSKIPTRDVLLNNVELTRLLHYEDSVLDLLSLKKWMHEA